MQNEPSTPVVDSAPRRRRLPRVLKLAVILAAVVVAFLLSIPWLLSTRWIRGKVESTLTEAAGAPVRIADHSFSWLSGFSIEGLEVDDPPGFPADRQAISLRSARGDIGLGALLRGRCDVRADVEGLQVLVFQKADGTTNLEALGKGARVETHGEEGEGRPAPSSATLDLGWLRIDAKLVDARVDLESEQGGVLESLRDVHATVFKSYGGSDLRLTLHAGLYGAGTGEPGRIDVEADVDAAMQRPAAVTWDVVGVDLARYRPLLETFVAADQVTALAGVLTGHGKADVDLQQKSVRLGGELALDAPHFAGPLFAGMDIRQPRWLVRPDLTVAMPADGAPPTVDAEGLHVDLGFLTVDGLAAAGASEMVGGGPALGVRFAVDLQQLVALGGPIPELLHDLAGKVEGRAALAATADAMDPAKLADQFASLLAADVGVSVSRFQVEGHDLSGLTAKLAVGGGDAKLTAGGKLGGAPLALSADVKPAQKAWPTDLSLTWKGGNAAGSAVRWLRYAVPVLAGLDLDQKLDFRSVVDLDLKVQGPLRSDSFDSRLHWLNQWRGGGDLGLRDCSFTPAGSLQQLFSLAGESGKVSFAGGDTKFALHDGVVETSLMKLSRKTSEIGLVGKTGLDGSLDYGIDLSGELARHKDGQRILAALGGKLPLARLGGTLDAPQLQMPELGPELLEGAVKGALQRGVDEGIKRGLEGLFGGKKGK